MRAVLFDRPGEADKLYLGEVPNPLPGPGEVLVRVRAFAVNRADVLQRRGGYEVPAGASPILGLEIAGDVAALGPEVGGGWQVGDRVFALVAGGAYAEYAVVAAGLLMGLPVGLSYAQAAAIPEAWLTAYLNMVLLGGLQAGQTVLVHAGGSGVGTAAIQLAHTLGARVITTAGSAYKLDRCRQLGADITIHYKEEDWLDAVQRATDQHGVDIILDFVGAPYWDRNLHALAMDGRLLLIGTLGGSRVDNLDLGLLMGRRLHVIGTLLRSRPLGCKIELTRRFADFALPQFASGKLQPVVDSVLSWSDVVAAHQRMEDNLNFGKIVLQTED